MRYLLQLVKLRLGVVSFILLALVGCNQDEGLDALKIRLVEIKQKPQGSIAVPPAFKFYDGFTYGASALRSPFVLPVAVSEANKSVGNTGIHPDPNRVKEPLEAFPIDSLKMVGSLRQQDKKLYGLVSDQEGNVYRVSVGNYMGRNEGKIISLSEVQIILRELVPDSMGGWIESSRPLSLKSE